MVGKSITFRTIQRHFPFQQLIHQQVVCRFNVLGDELLVAGLEMKAMYQLLEILMGMDGVILVYIALQSAFFCLILTWTVRWIWSINLTDMKESDFPLIGDWDADGIDTIGFSDGTITVGTFGIITLQVLQKLL